jgi:uridine kinase
MKILVVGAAATGKSTIAQLIKETLEKHGIESTITDDDYPNHLWQNERLQAISKSKETFEIITSQTR